MVVRSLASILALCVIGAARAGLTDPQLTASAYNMYYTDTASGATSVSASAGSSGSTYDYGSWWSDASAQGSIGLLANQDVINLQESMSAGSDNRFSLNSIDTLDLTFSLDRATHMDWFYSQAYSNEDVQLTVDGSSMDLTYLYLSSGALTLTGAFDLNPGPHSFYMQANGWADGMQMQDSGFLSMTVPTPEPGPLVPVLSGVGLVALRNIRRKMKLLKDA